MTDTYIPILHRPASAARLLGCSLRHIYDLNPPMYHPSSRVTLIRADDLQRFAGRRLDTYETVTGWPTVGETARMLHVSTRQIHRLMSDGTLPYRKKTSRRALIDPQAILRLVGGPA